MNFLDRFREPPQFRKSGILIVLISSLIWYGAYKIRGQGVALHCKNDPEICVLKDVFWLDRVLFFSESEEAHLFSFKTQNAAGVLAVSVPVFLSGVMAVTGRLSPAV